jgi:hypothetical protein
MSRQAISSDPENYQMKLDGLLRLGREHPDYGVKEHNRARLRFGISRINLPG